VREVARVFDLPVARCDESQECREDYRLTEKRAEAERWIVDELLEAIFIPLYIWAQTFDEDSLFSLAERF
jgi:hypothetical protein